MTEEILIMERTEEHMFPDVGEAMVVNGEHDQMVIYTRCLGCNNIIAIDSKNTDSSGNVIGEGHQITINNGKITVTPSLQCPECPWHVFLTDGKIYN